MTNVLAFPRPTQIIPERPSSPFAPPAGAQPALLLHFPATEEVKLITNSKGFDHLSQAGQEEVTTHLSTGLREAGSSFCTSTSTFPSLSAFREEVQAIKWTVFPHAYTQVGSGGDWMWERVALLPPELDSPYLMACSFAMEHNGVLVTGPRRDVARALELARSLDFCRVLNVARMNTEADSFMLAPRGWDTFKLALSQEEVPLVSGVFNCECHTTATGR